MPRALLTRLLALAAALALAAPWAASARAQTEAPTIAITEVDSQDFPTVSASLTVTGANGLPLVGLTSADFAVTEDGQAVPAGAVTLESDTSQPLTLVLAVDVALPAEALVTIQSALRGFTDGLTPRDQVALLTFGEEVLQVQGFTNDRLALATAIGGLARSGNATLFNEAAQTAVNLIDGLPDGGRKAVLLFTDSGDTRNTLSPEPILERARTAGVAIYPFGYGPRVNPTVLNNWARFTGGQAYVLSTAGEIQPNLQTLGVLMRQNYRLTFTSGLSADSARHNLTLQLDYQDQAVSAQSRFVATPGEVIVEGLTIANGQTLRGMVFLIAEVSAPAPVESVAFMLDGETLVELASPPYRFDWDTATAGAGTHAVTVVARDQAGNVGETQVSVNVAVPPPVIPTTAPVPTTIPAPNPVLGLARNAWGVGRQVLAGAGLLLAAVVALLLWLRARELEAPKTVTGIQLELINRGNARTRYELRAEDPGKLMKFNFLVNDASLATRKAAVNYAPAAAAQVAPAAGLASAGPAAAANGQANGQKKGGRKPNLKTPGVVRKAQSTAFAGVGVAARLSSWFMAVTYLMPGPLRMKFRGRTAAFRSDIDMVDDAAKMPTIYKNIVDDVVDVPFVGDRGSLGNLGGHGQPRSRQAQAAAPAATMQPAAVAVAPVGATLMTAGGGPATAPAAAATPALKAISANTAGWAVTPYVEPGGTLSIRLHITPRRVPKTQAYAFRVFSRSADSTEPNKLTQIEHGSVALTSPPWFRQVVTWLLLAVLLAAVTGLAWYLLTTFGVLGAG